MGKQHLELLFDIGGLCGIIAEVFTHYISFRLRSTHKELWNELGKPTMISRDLGQLLTNIGYMRFLWLGKKTGDTILDLSLVLCRIFGAVALTIFIFIWINT
jgi:hypothetical protein